MKTIPSAGSGNEDLFAMHRSARKRRRRRQIVAAVLGAALVLAALVVGITLLRNRVQTQFASSDGSGVESAQVTTGSISTTVSGSGTLADEDVESVTIPSSLEVETLYVAAGDSVTGGDLLATVTSASLLSAMSELQTALDELDETLEEAADDAVGSTISAGVSGRVKQINVSAGDDVASAMYEYGALMVLSLDGYMAVDVASDSLAEGDTVTVTLSDGTEVSGLVEKAGEGTATVLVTDNGTTYGDTVTVGDAEGTLYIHSPLSVTGYAGTVSSVKVSENKKVSSGTTLIKLTDTATSVSYDALLKERQTLEEELAQLVQIYKEGGIYAECSGVVESVSDDSSSAGMGTTSSYGDSAETTAETELAAISPNQTMSVTISVDETDILSLSEGQSASVYIDSIGDTAYTGTVTEVSTSSASSASGVTTYSAVVEIDKADGMLAGMSASVVITIQGVDNALLIPVEALHQTSSTAYVYTEYDESTGAFSGMTEVTVGLSNSSYVEITSGLSEGDTVYYTASEDSTSNQFSEMGGGMDFGGMEGGQGGMDFGGDSGPSDMGGGGQMSMPGN